MNKPNEYDTAEAKKQGGDFPQPPIGGHVLKVVNAIETKSSAGNQMLVLYFDIAEGEFANHYKELTEKIEKDAYLRQYQLTEGTHISYFKGLIELFELCNTGFKFNFDERSLIGKRIGANLREEEYLNKEDEVKTSLKIGYFTSILEVRDGLKPMKKKLLQEKKVDAPVSQTSPEDKPKDDDLPFIWLLPLIPMLGVVGNSVLA